jgi:hypothetical protein
MYMQRKTSGAAGNGLYTTAKYMRGATGIGIGTTIKHLRRPTSGAAGNGLGAAIKYLRRTTSAAANNGMSTTITPPCSAASFEVNSEPHRGTSLGPFVCWARAFSLCSIVLYRPVAMALADGAWPLSTTYLSELGHACPM